MWCLQEGSWDATQSFVWSVIGGFTRDVVAFQES